MPITDWSWWLTDISSRKSRILISQWEIETRTDLQQELREKKKRKAKAKQMPKTTPTEETASAASKKANVHSEKHAHSSMTRTRKARGKEDLVHLLRHVHRTETRKVTEKVAMTQVLKTDRKLLVKVSQEKRTDCLVQTSKGSCKHWYSFLAMFPNVQEFKAPSGCNFGDKCTFKHTAKHAHDKTIFSTDCYPHSMTSQVPLPRGTSPSCEPIRTEKRKMGPTLGAQNQRNPNALTFEERSIQWTLSMEESKKQLGFLHKNVHRVPSSYSENRNKLVLQIKSREQYLHLL